MTQVKKVEIKEKIDNAALKVFAAKDFEGVKIQDISKEAGVSVGNIYRYYKSKEEIFYSITPESTLNELKDILIKKITFTNDVETYETETESNFGLINEEFIDFMISNRERFLIMLSGSKGTKYASIQEEIFTYIIQTTKERYAKQDNAVIFDMANYEAVRMIYENFIHLIMRGLRRFESREELKRFFRIINHYHLFGVADLFK